MASTPQLRSAVAGDEHAVADLVVDAFEGYRAFAPAGWEPPDERGRTGEIRGWIEDPAGLTLVAEDGGLAGVVQWLPATDEPDLLHLRYLFIRQSHWGTGLATELHRRAIAVAHERGWPAMRLFTPAQQARARRFYEREGWTLSREAFHDAKIGFEVVEYRRVPRL